MRAIKTVQQFREFVGTDGKLFSVVFIKRDGSKRKYGSKVRC
jgi:hypothetical protein